jgi:hypothetical protein
VSPASGALRVELEGGTRREHDRPGTSLTSALGGTSIRWFGINSDVSLGRSWYLLFSATRETGAWESADQGYVSLTWRF